MGMLQRFFNVLKRIPAMSATPMTVLVITPNPSPISVILDRLGLDSKIVTSAADATNVARTKHYDFILVDLDTPGATTLVSNLRSYGTIVAIADACNTDAIRALMHGALECVTKSDLARDLMGVLTRMKAEHDVEGSTSTHSIIANALSSAARSLSRIDRRALLSTH